MHCAFFVHLKQQGCVAMVVAGKVVAALRPHAEVIVFFNLFDELYNEKSMFAGGQSNDCLARDVPGGPAAALLGHEHAVLDDLLMVFILNVTKCNNESGLIIVLNLILFLQRTCKCIRNVPEASHVFFCAFF